MEHSVLHIKISFFLCWRVENNYKSKSQHFMHQCIVSNKNFDFPTCGTQKFWQILTYQKIEQNWLVNPARIFKKRNRKFSKFHIFFKIFTKNVTYSQIKHNFEKMPWRIFFLKTWEGAQILIWKFRFTVALKLQRNFET